MEQIPNINYDQEWGLDPAYMTPAYLANFRPAYKEKLKQRARDVRGHYDTESKSARRR